MCSPHCRSSQLLSAPRRSLLEFANVRGDVGEFWRKPSQCAENCGEESKHSKHSSQGSFMDCKFIDFLGFAKLPIVFYDWTERPRRFLFGKYRGLDCGERGGARSLSLFDREWEKWDAQFAQAYRRALLTSVVCQSGDLGF